MPKAPLDADPTNGLYYIGSGSICADWDYLDDHDVLMATYITRNDSVNLLDFGCSSCLQVFEWVDFQ